MKEMKVITAHGGRKFEIPENLLPGFEVFVETTLSMADTEFRDSISGDVAVGLVSLVLGEANRGATHEEQLEIMKKFIKLSIQRNDNTIIPFLRDELGLPLIGEDLALRDF